MNSNERATIAPAAVRSGLESPGQTAKPGYCSRAATLPPVRAGAEGGSLLRPRRPSHIRPVVPPRPDQGPGGRLGRSSCSRGVHRRVGGEWRNPRQCRSWCLAVAQVRLRAAQCLLPAIIRLMEESSLGVAWQGEELPRWAVGKGAPQEIVWSAAAAERRQCWVAWRRLSSVRLPWLSGPRLFT
jgi:hypothetical protein